MTAIKESSTQNFNKESAELRCPVTYVMNRIGGHWKPIILYQLKDGPLRYSQIKRAIPSVTEKMLIQHLKQMEADKLIIRKAEPVVPPFVTYKLSKAGETLMPVMTEMVKWALNDVKCKAGELIEAEIAVD